MSQEDKTRIIWEFCIGIPITNDNMYESRKETFEQAVYDITEELTKISEGLTYKYCYGTWLKGKNSLPNVELKIERNYSVTINTIVLVNISRDFYDSAKKIISNVNKHYDLGINHVQAMKTYGTEYHFICEGFSPSRRLGSVRDIAFASSLVIL
jgi:hypothetical protein